MALWEMIITHASHNEQGFSVVQYVNDYRLNESKSLVKVSL